MLLSSQGAALPAGRHMHHATGFAGTELGKPQARIGGKARDGRDETGRHRQVGVNPAAVQTRITGCGRPFTLFAQRRRTTVFRTLYLPFYIKMT